MPPGEAVPALPTAVAAGLRLRQNVPPPVWVVCALRLTLAAVAAAALPLRIPLTGPVGVFLNAEALLLLVSCLVLPLPLRHHLWVQLLALRSAVARMRRLAWMYAALPRHATECARFVLNARLGMQAVLPGGLPPMQLPPPGDCCWMLHTWVAVMAGFALPAALLAALEQHRQQRERQLRLRLPAPLGSAAGTIAGSSGTEASPAASSLSWKPSAQEVQAQRSGPLQGQAAAACGAGAAHAGGGGQAGSPGSGQEGSGSGSDQAFSRLLPPGIDASNVSGASSPSNLSAVLGGGSADQGWWPEPPALVGRLQLGVLLFQWLALLLPAGCCVWAMLEVAVRFTAVTA